MLNTCACGCGETIPKKGQYLYRHDDGKFYRPGHRNAVAGVSDRIQTLIHEAMRDAWNTICSDTGCHPNDLKHDRGKFFTFEPGHWADLIAAYVAHRVANDVAYADLRASGGIFPANAP